MMKKITMQLETLVCPTCKLKVETALKKAVGVRDVSILFHASKANITYDETKTNEDTLKKIILGLGYDVLRIK